MKPASVRGCAKPQLICSEVGAQMQLTTAERQKLYELRRQMRQITMERDILAKATTWFANKDSGVDKTFIR